MMLWITLLFALLIAMSALGYVLWPLISQESPLLPLEDGRLADLLARKDTALRAIKDLEFDHQVGKIGDEDYERLRNRLNRQAITLLQQLERLTPESTALDGQLEAEIAKLRRVQASSRVDDSSATVPRTKVTQAATVSSGAVSSGTVSSGAVSSGEVTMAIGTEGGKARFCTECGVKVDPSFKFCGNCGAAIARIAATVADEQ